MNDVPSHRRINWHQATAEVVLIMVGILAALAIDSWWDEKSEREAEAEYLKSLQAEFTANRVSLLAGIEEEEQFLYYGKQILSNFRSGQTKLTRQELLENLRGFIVLSSWTPSTGTYDELVGSGRLSYLQSEELRVALATFRYTADQFHSYRADQNSFHFAIFGPFLHENLDMSVLGWIGDYEPESPFPMNFEKLQSQAFWNATVEWMSLHYSPLEGAYGFRKLLVQTEKILDMIDAELAGSSD